VRASPSIVSDLFAWCRVLVAARAKLTLTVARQFNAAIGHFR
jgi:hypothetical protein